MERGPILSAVISSLAIPRRSSEVVKELSEKGLNPEEVKGAIWNDLVDKGGAVWIASGEIELREPYPHQLRLLDLSSDFH